VSRRVLGSTVVGGMLASTLVAIFIIPVCFSWFERAKKVAAKDSMDTVDS